MSDVQEVERHEQSFSILPLAFENVQVIGPSSPIVPQTTRPHGSSCCARCSHRPVDYFDLEGVLDYYDLWGSLDYFNLEGVNQLPLTLPLASQSTRGPGAVFSGSSESLSVPTGPFDFEKTLRTIMKKYVIASVLLSIPLYGELGNAAQVSILESLVSCLRTSGLLAWGLSPAISLPLGLFSTPRSSSRRFRPHVTPPCAISSVALKVLFVQAKCCVGIPYFCNGSDMISQSTSVVLGNPGSGCSTLLKTLTNQRAEYHLVEGDVYYDSFTPEYIAKHYRGDVVYSPEDDIHFPTLTVDETLRFAAKMRAPHNRLPLEGSLRSHFVRRITEITQTIFGLRHVKNTPVGDAAIRGVSGGEKKRVSISEAMTLRSRITAWDK